jgi:hypothetical protein
MKNFNEWRQTETSRELWTDFEKWLSEKHNLTLKDLSWNSYIAYSKEWRNS